METTIPAAFAAAVRREPTTPLLTWYDDATGDRTELSGATLDNWLAKTANLLVDGAGLGAGDTAGVLLPPHWQTAAVLLGAWAAGLAVQVGGPPQPVDVLFSTPDADAAGAWSAGDRYVTGLLPLAMPLRDVPPGSVDYPTEVRNYGDHFRATRPVGPDAPAFAGAGPRSHADAMRAATERAAALGLAAGARVLIDARAHPDPADWLLAPLAAGASIVLCAHLDAAKVPDRVSAERVTHTLA
ncbi:TIGR03089 family protein [Jidongwangia harbinensis]|uniref:TIGR03089 family protein n=1 Tax=Jidongwangia harbinensis TaxID=2878561 RepID=UPI001CDA35DF|nr:TIGR03089 family protein [Jidongwangia harbinensis]MCA2215596.1 TIGR03089 family protein [Jidongwangia harbinensis]